jgi:hypothetical protein
MRTAGIIRIIIGLVIAALLTVLLVVMLTGRNAVNVFGLDGTWIGSIVNRSIYLSGGVNADTNEVVVSEEARISADGIQKIQIDWVAGEVTLRVGSSDEIVFSESSHGSLEDWQKMRYSVSENGTLQIRYYDNQNRNFNWFIDNPTTPAKKLTMEVPASLIGQLTNLAIDTVSSSINVDDVYGTKTDLSTVSGRIHCVNVDCGTLSLASTSGAIVSENCTAKTLKLNNVSGGISAAGDYAGIDAETVSGSVRLACSAVPLTIRADSVSGGITVALPDGANFTAKLDSVSGSISCDFPGKLGEDMVVVGDGGSTYRFNTVSGSLKIEKNA